MDISNALECGSEIKNNHVCNSNNILEMFLKPFLNRMDNFKEKIYTKQDLIFELQEFYSNPTFCPGCHVAAFELTIIDNLEYPEDTNNILNDIIIPTIIEILHSYQIDTSEIITNVTQNWYIQQEKKPKPVTKDIIEYINQLSCENICDHGCFCGDENNKQVIKLNCCNKYVHKECILKWFQTNNTCPYCRNKY